MTVLHVEVTPHHIGRGKPGEDDSCPIALALNDLGCQDVAVTYDEVSFKYLDVVYNLNLPAEGSDFIELFDEEATQKDVTPIQFDLDLGGV